MVITVSAIFGICWLTNELVFTLWYVAYYDIGPVPFNITSTMILFNSAVNPFAYALLNQQFREKMKRILCCTRFSTSRVRPAGQDECMEPAHTAEASATEL